MDTKEIKKVIEALEDTDIIELAWEKDGQKIGLCKRAIVLKTKVDENKKPAAVVDATQTAGVPGIIANKVGQNGHTLKSPMVGTFYVSPAPDSPPYVLEGSTVKKGQKIALVEAMKIMKDLTADIDGKIEKILVENGHHIEYGQALFIIEPSGEISSK